MNTLAVKVSKRLTLGTDFAEVHKVYSTRQLFVTMIHIVNTTGADVTVKLCFVAPGESPSQSNSLLWEYTIPGNDFIEFGEGQIGGSSFRIMASANAGGSINLFFTGYEE
jgi:hypothetical protein